jgi:hypothetical protein
LRDCVDVGLLAGEVEVSQDFFADGGEEGGVDEVWDDDVFVSVC